MFILYIQYAEFFGIFRTIFLMKELLSLYFFLKKYKFVTLLYLKSSYLKMSHFKAIKNQENYFLKDTNVNMQFLKWLIATAQNFFPITTKCLVFEKKKEWWSASTCLLHISEKSCFLSKFVFIMEVKDSIMFNKC